MQLIHDYIVSLVNLYGIVHKEKVIEIYNEQNTDRIELTTLDKIIQEDADQLAKHFAFIEKNYFVQEAVIMFDDIDDELIKREGKPFYIPPKNELLKYKDEFYFEKTKQYDTLLQFITNHFTDGNKVEANEICEDIQLMCQDEFSPSTVFNQARITFGSEGQFRQALNLVIDLANNTRLWENNGFTPNELSQMYDESELHNRHMIDLSTKSQSKQSTVKLSRKVGRNEPCPCGSGKKYKRCCLT